MNRDEARTLLKEIKAKAARRDACPGHVFEHKYELSNLGRHYRCTQCDWRPDPGELLAYLQGIEHAAQGHTKEKTGCA